VTEAVQVTGLTKIYPAAGGRPPVHAVDGIDFTVHEGEVFGFLGPNGAGKTTTIRMLTGLARPTAGHARVEVEPVVRLGVPWQQIVAAAEELEVNMIVLGAHGKHAWKTLLLGNTVENVTKHATCPVMIIR
jgi:ABC-type multidrug transport system ATPase subunit